METDIYGSNIPAWLRRLGCWGIQDGSNARFSWGDVSWRRWGYALQLCHFHEHASFHIHLGKFSIFITLPDAFNRPVPDGDIMGRYGFSWPSDGYFSSLHLNWGGSFKIIHMPWDWSHVRHDILMADGTWKRVVKRAWIDGEKNHDGCPWNWTDKHQETHPYIYTLKNGTVQERTATIGVEEREWRWRWFKWLPFPRMIHRTIDVQFSDEVGERSGSWKGGCLGCGYDMREGETPLECLRRMEKERRFN